MTSQLLACNGPDVLRDVAAGPATSRMLLDCVRSSLEVSVIGVDVSN